MKRRPGRPKGSKNKPKESKNKKRIVIEDAIDNFLRLIGEVLKDVLATRGDYL